MAARETVSLSLKADISDLKRELGSIPGITKKQASKMARELQTQYNKAERAAKKAAKSTKASWADAGRGAAQVGAAVAGAAVAVVAFGQHMADLNNQLTDTATVSTLAVEQIAGIKLAAEGSGVAFASVEKGLRALPKVMNDAANGTGAAAGAFDDLGISVRDASTGGLRDASEVLPEIFEALNGLPDQASKSAAAMDIFGAKAGGALVQSGAIENLDTFVGLASEFGISTGPKAAKAAADFQRQMASLKLVTEGSAARISEMIGGMEGLSTGLVVAAQGIIFTTKLVPFFADNFAAAVFPITTVITLVGGLAEALYDLSQGDFSGAARSVAEGVSDAASVAADSIVALVMTPTRAVDAWDEAVAATERYTAAVVNISAPNPEGPDVPTPDDGSGNGVKRDTGGSTTEIDARATAFARLQDQQKKASESRLSESAKIQLAFEREIDTIAEAMAAGVDYEETQAAINIAQTERLILMAGLKGRLHDEEMARMDAEAEKARQSTIAIVGATGDAVGALANLAGAAGTAMAQAGTKGAKKNAAIMFGVSKALALSMIPLRLAEGLMTAAAQPYPLNGIMAATVIATAGAQGIAVASAKPPTFDRGGIINAGTGDQMMTATLPGESILSREATSRLGADGVNDLNRGRSAQGPTVVQMVYRHRIFDEFITDNMSAPTPLGQAVRGDRVAGRRS